MALLKLSYYPTQELMKTFNEIISEATDKDTKVPFRLVVLADRPKTVKDNASSTKLVRAAEKNKLEVYNCRVNGAFVIRDQDTGEIRVHNADDDEGFVLDADTIVMNRGSVTRKDSYLDLISQIERYGIATCNPRECIEVCSDKFRTYLRLQEIGMNQPRTVLIPNDEPETVDRAHEALDNEFPMVLKTLQGSKGVGVLLIETERSLQSQVSLIYKIDPFCDILLQEYIESDYDVRVVIVNREIIGAMKRNKITGDFRSNMSQGAKADEVELTDLEKDQCLQAAKAVNGQWVGVDFIPAKNRDKDAPYIIEVNHSPGTAGISNIIKQNVSELVIDKYMDREIWKYSPKECGVLETMEIDGEEMTAKLDTGNNTTVCSLHAEDVNIKGKKVTWTGWHGKKHSAKLERMVSLIKPEDERPVVKMEINFLNTIYEQEVSLDKRNSIPFLVNRDFMKRANLMINPARKFLLTNRRDDSATD